MKIALCISGHFRFFKDTLQNWYDLFYKPMSDGNSIDIFISTWDELNALDSFSVQQKDSLIDNNKLNEDEIQNIFNPIEMVVEDFTQLKDNFTIDKFYTNQRVHPGTYNHESKIHYCLPMFYKWFQCNELKKKYEAENNFRYDLVVKSRPDIFFLRPILSNEFDPQYLYMRQRFQDFLLFSSSKNIDIVTSIWTNFKHLIETYDSDCCPEQNLFYHNEENGLDMSKMKMIGENSFWLYPRKNFLLSVYHILERVGTPNQFNDLMNKYGRNLQDLK